MAELTGAIWRKSSRSNGGANGNCVEVAGNLPGIVGVRDSKEVHGPVLAVVAARWVVFTEMVKGGAFDR